MGRPFAILFVLLVGCPPVEEPLEDRCVSDVPWAPGTPVFRDATDAWGMTDLNVLGHQINVTDLEGDGFADLIVHTEGGHDDFVEGGERVTWVLRNTGAGFEDVTESSNFRVRRDPAPGETWGRQGTIMASADVDNDGDVDVYTAHWAWNGFEQTDWSETVLNDGTGHFELGPAEGDHRREGENPTRPASVAFTDYDRDGLVDLWLVQNGFLDPYPDPDILFEGRGDGSFRDVTARRGIETLPWTNIGALNQAMGHTWGWAATACDLDDDGLPELMAASYGRTPNQLWHPGRDEEGRVVFTNAWSRSTTSVGMPETLRNSATVPVPRPRTSAPRGFGTRKATACVSAGPAKADCARFAGSLYSPPMTVVLLRCSL